MNIVKIGFFWRIDTGKMISKRRFLQAKSALRYYFAHQDKNGFPVIERKRK